MNRFAGKVAFVTGGGHGIGRATAGRLAAEGAAVVLADLDLDAAQRAAADLRAAGRTASAVRLDITDRASVEAAVADSVDGRLDVLVNTAGGDYASVDPMQGDEPWTQLQDLNLTGTVRCIRACRPALLADPDGGAVVTVGSINGLVAFGSDPYSAAKAGLSCLTLDLAARYAARGLRFNLVAPGTVRARNRDGQPGALDGLTRCYPLGRIGEPEDIAAAITFLASGDASWMTGVVLPVEGGVQTGPMAHLARH